MPDEQHSSRNIISPEIQVMVDVTKANTEQLVRVNEFLRSISADIKTVRTYFEGKDGLQRDLDDKFKQHTTWLWLKLAGAMSVVSGILILLVELIDRRALH